MSSTSLKVCRRRERRRHPHPSYIILIHRARRSHRHTSTIDERSGGGRGERAASGKRRGEREGTKVCKLSYICRRVCHMHSEENSTLQIAKHKSQKRGKEKKKNRKAEGKLQTSTRLLKQECMADSVRIRTGGQRTGNTKGRQFHMGPS